MWPKEVGTDEVVSAVDEKLMNIPGEQGILFDGFPRTIHQARSRRIAQDDQAAA